VTPAVVWTGQHRALDPSQFGLDGYPSIKLDCPGMEDPHHHVAAVARALRPLLRSVPDLLIVQGDTSSALGGALAGFSSCVPVAHVEAGLRTHDPSLPWPEEEYRTAIDADADLLFAPTELAAANLRAEKVPGEIYITGNSGIDALLETASRLPPPSIRDGGGPRLLFTCHRRESWADGLPSIAGAAHDLASQGAETDFLLHPNAFVATRMRSLLNGVRGIRLLNPCGHEELLYRMRNSDLVLSDSGGIQEEAPAFGVPLLILRDKTERPEGIASGSSRLVGTDRERIVTEARSLIDDPVARAAMSRPTLPFGDGHAGPRIASIIMSWLQERSLTRRLA
jgi:UDP-N-acetylglucosamine 2-epimerase (non-hydrolysing)